MALILVVIVQYSWLRPLFFKYFLTLSLRLFLNFNFAVNLLILALRILNVDRRQVFLYALYTKILHIFGCKLTHYTNEIKDFFHLLIHVLILLISLSIQGPTPNYSKMNLIRHPNLKENPLESYISLSNVTNFCLISMTCLVKVKASVTQSENMSSMVSVVRRDLVVCSSLMVG